jgi:hypothetical protein
MLGRHENVRKELCLLCGIPQDSGLDMFSTSCIRRRTVPFAELGVRPIFVHDRFGGVGEEPGVEYAKDHLNSSQRRHCT